jgi:hypothetical protein
MGRKPGLESVSVVLAFHSCRVVSLFASALFSVDQAVSHFLHGAAFWSHPVKQRSQSLRLYIGILPVLQLRCLSAAFPPRRCTHDGSDFNTVDLGGL